MRPRTLSFSVPLNAKGKTALRRHDVSIRRGTRRSTE
jgi:hypothetical protein